MFGPHPRGSKAFVWRHRKQTTENEPALDALVLSLPLTQCGLIRGEGFFLIVSPAHSQPVKAAIEFSKLLDLLPEGRGYDDPRSNIILEMARWDRAYAKLIELRPNAQENFWTGRGRYYALRSQWNLAAVDFAYGINSAPPESGEWLEHASLRLLRGDKEGYRMFVQEMRRREGQSKDPLCGVRIGSDLYSVRRYRCRARSGHSMGETSRG